MSQSDGLILWLNQQRSCAPITSGHLNHGAGILEGEVNPQHSDVRHQNDVSRILHLLRGLAARSLGIGARA
jgi:hypothetical protein